MTKCFQLPRATGRSLHFEVLRRGNTHILHTFSSFLSAAINTKFQVMVIHFYFSTRWLANIPVVPPGRANLKCIHGTCVIQEMLAPSGQAHPCCLKDQRRMTTMMHSGILQINLALVLAERNYILCSSTWLIILVDSMCTLLMMITCCAKCNFERSNLVINFMEYRLLSSFMFIHHFRSFISNVIACTGVLLFLLFLSES